MAAHQVVRLRPLTFRRSNSDDFSRSPTCDCSLPLLCPLAGVCHCNLARFVYTYNKPKHSDVVQYRFQLILPKEKHCVRG